ncbi:MAG: DUF1292 domain-containing protein [Lachnospiraceae bacterium]
MADYNDKIDNEDKMTLYLDDGTEMVCDVIGIFDDGERDYIALFPEDGDEDSDIFLYRFIMEDEDFDNIKLENIESDEEFDSAAAAFEAYMEQMEILDEDDEIE